MIPPHPYGSRPRRHERPPSRVTNDRPSNVLRSLQEQEARVYTTAKHTPIHYAHSHLYITQKIDDQDNSRFVDRTNRTLADISLSLYIYTYILLYKQTLQYTPRRLTLHSVCSAHIDLYQHPVAWILVRLFVKSTYPFDTSVAARPYRILYLVLEMDPSIIRGTTKNRYTIYYIIPRSYHPQFVSVSTGGKEILLGNGWKKNLFQIIKDRLD